MKKLILFTAVITSFALSSCGGKDGEDQKDSGGPSLCDCVNMKDDADDKMKEACKTMEQEWKDKYDKASDEEKKKLQEEVEACAEKK